MRFGRYCWIFALLNIVHAASSWHLDVQSKFVEGWDGDASQTMHMIVINAGETMDEVIRPLNASDSVMIMVNQDLKIGVPVSDGDEHFELEKQVPMVFNLNNAGRFSFTVAVEEMNGREKNIDLPQFMIRTNYMDPNEWLIVLPAYDSWDRLSKLDAKTLQLAYPSISVNLAQSVAVFVSKLSLMAKSARPNLGEEDIVVKNVKYNPTTNRLPSYVVNSLDVSSVSSSVHVPLEYEFLVSYGKLSQSNQSVVKRGLNHESEHADHVMDFYWKAMDTLNSEAGLNFSDITNDIDIDHMAVTSEPKTSKMMVVFQKRGLSDIYHSIVDTTKGILQTIQLVLGKVGIFITDLFKYLRGQFNWGSISRTVRFLTKYHRVYGAFQSYGLNFTQKRLEKAFGSVFMNFQNNFDAKYARFGAKRVNSSMYHTSNEQEALHAAKSSIGLDNSTSTGDARVNYLQDRIMASMEDVRPVNDVSFQKNMKKLFRLGSEMGKELMTALPDEHREKLRHIVLEFDDDSFFVGRVLARAFQLIESISVFVGELVSYVLRGLGRFLNVMIQVSTTLLELPIYVPIFSSLWAKVIAPGTGEMSILSIFCLLGGIPSTLFYRAYRGREPFSVEDINALETVKIPQLFLYTWNNHELTRTSDPHELKRRDGVFDWILRMAAAHTTSLMVISSLSEIVTKKNEIASLINPPIDDINGKYKKINLVMSLVRYLGVLQIMVYIYPFSQLSTPDPIAIENDMMNPERRTILWWGAMQIGFALKLIALSGPKYVVDTASKIATSIIAPMQTIAASMLSTEILQRTNPRNWKRAAVSYTCVSAFAVDTANQWLGLLPPKYEPYLGNFQTSTAAALSYGYELRAHLMMGLHVIGLFAPANEKLEDHRP